MTNTTMEMTRDPLPGRASFTWDDHQGRCRTCGDAPPDIRLGPLGATPYTRSVSPAADGTYAIQFHHDWCPTFTGETPELPCPRCGAPVNEWRFAAGLAYPVPGAGLNGRTDHLLVEGGSEGAVRVPARASLARPERWPGGDRLTVAPCGHVLEDDQAREVLAAATTIAAGHRRTERDAVIAGHADLLATAEAAGFGELADAYRYAVHNDLDTARGMLAAIKVLVET